VLRPIQTNRFAPWPGAQFPASLQQEDAIIAREFSNTRGKKSSRLAAQRLNSSCCFSYYV